MAGRNYGKIDSIDELAKAVDRLLTASGPFGFDIETGYAGPDMPDYSLHPETAFVVGFSFTNSTHWARYIPLRHDIGDNLDNTAAARLLWPLLGTGMGVAHNATFELRHLSRWFTEYLRDDPIFGAAVRASGGYFPIRSDTQVEAYLVAEHPKFGLKYLTEAIFGHRMTELYELFDDLPKNRRNMLRFNILELTPRVIEYACEDAVWCLAIHERYHERARTMQVADCPCHPNTSNGLLYRAEMGIVEGCIPEMEDFGVRYDWLYMRRGSEAIIDFKSRFNAEIMTELTELTGEPTAINLGSPVQVSNTLYTKLGMRTTRYTKSTRNLPPAERKMSTDKIALTGLAQQHPVVRKILQWKEMTKLTGTYLGDHTKKKGPGGYETKFSYASDGRTHPHHMSAVVVTGRFAVSDPPYQQSPKMYHFDLECAKVAHREHAEAHGPDCACEYFAPPPGSCVTFNFRDAIIPPPDHYILGFDLSQAELRAIAGEAQETALLRAFETGQDVHTLTAALMLKIPVEEVTKDLRGIGKAQPLDAKVLTPQGFRRMGDLQVGDQVIGSDGHPTKITGVFPQGLKDCYRVEFTDGSVECCDEHLWTVKNINNKNGPWVTKSLRQLVTSGLHRKPQIVKGKEYQQPKYRLPDRPVVQFDPGPELPIDPYVLGLLLGDGGFTHSWAPMFGSADRELLDAVRVEHESRGGLWASEEEASPGFWRAYLAAGRKFDRSANATKTALRELDLWGKRDHEKFVPEMYLKGRPADRLALLQGLLDTDGNVQASGAMFRVTSKALAEAVQFLARSLGGFASLDQIEQSPGPFHVKSAPRPLWRVYLRLPVDTEPFRLTRKAGARKSVKYGAVISITGVEHVGRKVMQCISVEAQNGLYVTDEFNITHNTMNFALLYGMGVKSLAERLGLPVEEAQVLYDKYFAVYSAIAVWAQRQVEHGKRYGYVVSRFGRRLPIWEYSADQQWFREKGDRACVNYPIQGAATGDFMKIAMVAARKVIRTAGLHDRVHMVMNVHDALEFYVHRSVRMEDLIHLLEPAVLSKIKGWPAMQADWHVAKKWGSPKDIIVNDDGSITIKGEKEWDLVPEVEEDEETGEEIVILPEVDPEALRRAITEDFFEEDEPVEQVTAAFDAGREPRRVIVELADMPTEDAYDRFTAWLPSGADTVTIRTPEGDLTLPSSYSLSLDDVAQVSMILGPVSIVYDAADVDASELVDGLLL